MIASRFSTVAPSATASVVTASSSPYIDASRTPSPEGAKTASTATIAPTALTPPRYGIVETDGSPPTERSMKKSAGAAERPGERVEAEQLERRSRRQRRDLVAPNGRSSRLATRPRTPAGRAGTRRATPKAASGSSGTSRAADDREPDEEDDDAGDRREPGLEQDRREHDRRVLDAEPPQRDDARSRRPDAARDVLREHREHLGLQRVRGTGSGSRTPRGSGSSRARRRGSRRRRSRSRSRSR